MSKLTCTEIQQRIDAIESKYYKGWKQSEEWWRVTGDVLMINPTSIPEHSDFTKELDKHITEIATAKEKIAVLEDDLAYLGKDH